MIDIPLALRVPPQGRYNRGIYICYECGFEPPHCNVVPCMLGLAETSTGTMVIRECLQCGQKWMFHYRAPNAREAYDCVAQLLAYRRGDPD